MRDFRELKVWQRAHQLTLSIYKESARFPDTERYGLTSQIRRAAASIGANIAEGAGKTSYADFGRFLQMALGSASELEYHLLLARDFGYIAVETYEPLQARITELKRMLTKFVQHLNVRVATATSH